MEKDTFQLSKVILLMFITCEIKTIELEMNIIPEEYGNSNYELWL